MSLENITNIKDIIIGKYIYSTIYDDKVLYLTKKSNLSNNRISLFEDIDCRKICFNTNYDDLKKRKSIIITTGRKYIPIPKKRKFVTSIKQEELIERIKSDNNSGIKNKKIKK